MVTPTGSGDRLPSFRLQQGVYSLTDQVLSVGGMFLVNLALARTISKPEYGLFTLAYSVFTFLAGLHNAALLEAYTVYGSGRYRERHRAYAWLMWRSNALLGALLTTTLVVIWFALLWLAPGLASWPLLGLALTSALILTASLLRRTLYVQRKPKAAAAFSAVFFLTVVIVLWCTIRTGFLNGLTAFLIVAIGWVVGGVVVGRKMPKPEALTDFFASEPNHWREHWRYSRWVLVTALIFQFTTQAYYWIVAGSLSLKEVAELRAMYMLIAPVDQVFTAVTLIILPALAAHFAEQQNRLFVMLWRRYFLIFLVISVVYATASFTFGRFAIHILYGGKFDEVSSLFSTMALLPVIMGIGHTMNAALKAAEKPNAVFAAYAVSAVATIGIGVPLVARFGLHGAIVGMLVSGTMYTTGLAVNFGAFLSGNKKLVQLEEDSNEEAVTCSEICH